MTKEQIGDTEPKETLGLEKKLLILFNSHFPEDSFRLSEFITNSGNLNSETKRRSEMIYQEMIFVSLGNYDLTLKSLRQVDQKLLTLEPNPRHAFLRRLVKSIRGKVVYHAHKDWMCSIARQEQEKANNAAQVFMRTKKLKEELVEDPETFNLYQEAADLKREEVSKRIEKRTAEVEDENDKILKADGLKFGHKIQAGIQCFKHRLGLLKPKISWDSLAKIGLTLAALPMLISKDSKAVANPENHIDSEQTTIREAEPTHSKYYQYDNQHSLNPQEQVSQDSPKIQQADNLEESADTKNIEENPAAVDEEEQAEEEEEKAEEDSETEEEKVEEEQKKPGTIDVSTTYNTEVITRENNTQFKILAGIPISLSTAYYGPRITTELGEDLTPPLHNVLNAIGIFQNTFSNGLTLKPGERTFFAQLISFGDETYLNHGKGVCHLAHTFAELLGTQIHLANGQDLPLFVVDPGGVQFHSTKEGAAYFEKVYYTPYATGINSSPAGQLPFAVNPNLPTEVEVNLNLSYQNTNPKDWTSGTFSPVATLNVSGLPQDSALSFQRVSSDRELLTRNGVLPDRHNSNPWVYRPNYSNPDIKTISIDKLRSRGQLAGNIQPSRHSSN